MDNTKSVIRLQGKIQHYQWGGKTYLPELLNANNTEQKPFAEYWLGAHVNAPSSLHSGANLDAFISENPGVLGSKASIRFGRLPYLLKILDVHDMLSIQVHPTKEAAVAAYAAENKAGVPINAGNRNYKDDNHKPELMLALSEFWLLHGFRNALSLKKTIASVPEFDFMLPVFEKGSYKALYEMVMTMPQSEVNKTLQPLLDRIIPLYNDNKLSKHEADFWAARAAQTFSNGNDIDRGIFSIYLFNVVYMKKGEAIFQDAGIPHAYLEGQNVEIMANSDNVLRGGLTPKHVDVPELMKHVVFEAVEPNIIQGSSVTQHEKVFLTPAPDFELSKIALAAGESYRINIYAADIFFVFAGDVAIDDGQSTLKFKKGESFVSFNGAVLNLTATENTEIYKATVPGS